MNTDIQQQHTSAPAHTHTRAHNVNFKKENDAGATCEHVQK